MAHDVEDQSFQEESTAMPPLLATDEALACPLCTFRSSRGEYELLLHMETNHSEGPSPFVVADGPKISCSHADCGEVMAPNELDYHLQMHSLEATQHVPVVDEENPSSTISGANGIKSSASGSSSIGGPRTNKTHRVHSQRNHVAQAWRMLFATSKTTRKNDDRTKHRRRKEGSRDASPHRATEEKDDRRGAVPKASARLGKSELGRFANEREMPTWLVGLLSRDGQACSDGVLPVLQQLLEQSPSTSYAYLCHPIVHHVSKLRREGGFCGYRNIQMLVSHIIEARMVGCEKFGPQFPSIFQIQDIIENAWDMGINPQGRIETGGIRGTRKYIGTPEAQAFFRSLEIPCWVQAFKDKNHEHAGSLLLRAIEDYFERGWKAADESKTRLTSLAPIYFQHRGHSLTIIGLEKLVGGNTQLLVFDPTFRDSHAIRQLIGREFQSRTPMSDGILEPYRRGKQYLKKYGEFELLYLGSKDTIEEGA